MLACLNTLAISSAASVGASRRVAVHGHAGAALTALSCRASHTSRVVDAASGLVIATQTLRSTQTTTIASVAICGRRRTAPREAIVRCLAGLACSAVESAVALAGLRDAGVAVTAALAIEKVAGPIAASIDVVATIDGAASSIVATTCAEAAKKEEGENAEKSDHAHWIAGDGIASRVPD